MLKRRVFLLLIITLLTCFSIFSNTSIGYALEDSKAEGGNTEFNYFIIHYNGEEQEVVINDDVTLILNGWTNEENSAVNVVVKSVSDSTIQAKSFIIPVSEELNQLKIAEDEEAYYRIVNADTLSAKKVVPLQLSEQVKIIKENENGTLVEEQKTVDEYGTVIENAGFTYYLTDKNNQRVAITQEEYEALNNETELDISAEKIITDEIATDKVSTEEVDIVVGTSKDQLKLNQRTLNPVSEEDTQVTARNTSVSASLPQTPSVVYSTHVETHGWLDAVKDGGPSGTEGEAKRMEAIKIHLEDAPEDSGISYKTHVQSKGWLDTVFNGDLSGTSGERKRMEAIQINLTGEVEKQYDVYYRVHAQSYGWLGWAKNGQSAGTQGLAKRLEAIEIVIVEKSGAAPGPTDNHFVFAEPSIIYSSHVQDYGWLPTVADGKPSGTEGEAKRMEAIKISLANALYEGGITYSTHMQTYGWLDSAANGNVSGKTGERKRMEAIQINLTDDMANHYDVYYRVHAESYGWLDWAKNGQTAGTQGLAKRLEAIETVLVEKGGTAPGPTTKPMVADPSVVYSTHVESYGWLPPVVDGELSGTEGQRKRMEAIELCLANIPYPGGISYRTHVQSYGWLDLVTNGTISGKTGESKRMEAIQINLTGEMANYYDVYYRVHAESYGWLDWAKNGQSAGTANLAKRLEAIQIVLVEKGGAAPGQMTTPFIQPSLNISYKNYDLALTNAVNIQMALTNPRPQTDDYLYTSAYASSQYLDVYERGAIAGISAHLRTSPYTANENNITYRDVEKGVEFKILDNNVTGSVFQESTRWFKIEYNGQVLFVHSKLAAIIDKVGEVTADSLTIHETKDENSHVLFTAKKGTLLKNLEEGNNGWNKVVIDDFTNAKATDVEEYINPSLAANDAIQRMQFMVLSQPAGMLVETLNQYLTGKGSLAGQGQAFIDAAQKFGINEVYLVAHALHETWNGTSALASGVKHNGQTVYNMYGIGALDSCAVNCGSQRAYEEKWYSVYDAIVGGARVISEKYINGINPYNTVQNTVYEMRWNPEIMTDSGSAVHQYASDIGWASKIAIKMNDIYNIQPYSIKLEIPLYK